MGFDCEGISGERVSFDVNEMNVMSQIFCHDYYEYLHNNQFYRMLPDGLVRLGPYNLLLYEILACQNMFAVRVFYDGRQETING